jgi:hypothetical protein
MTQPQTRQIRTAQDAQALLTSLAATMNGLVALVEKETGLMRAGHLKEAAELEASKNELSRRYMLDAKDVKANNARLKALVPALFTEATRAHDTFRAVLQMNLTVLATAHAVSEGILRGVAQEMTRKSTPTAYSAFGRTTPQPRSATTPIAVSRKL